MPFDLSIGVFDASSHVCVLLPRRVILISNANNNHPPVGHPAQHGLLGGEAALKQLRRRLQFLVHLPLTLLSRIVMMMMMCKMVMYSYLSWCALGLLETNLKKGKDLCRN